MLPAGGRHAPAEPMRPRPGARTPSRRHRPPRARRFSPPPRSSPRNSPRNSPETAPEAPRGRTRDGGSSRRGGGHRPRKHLVRSAAAARRAAAGALLLLTGALGVPGSAEAQTGTLALNVGPIAGDNTVNIAEKAAGFTISGDTGSEAGVSVNVTIGSQSPLAASSGAGGAWSVNVPANAAYIAESSVAVTVSASKAGFTSPSPVTRPLAVDLTAPSVTYSDPPASLRVGGGMDGIALETTDGDIASHRATGFPSWVDLSFLSSDGVIDGFIGWIFLEPDSTNPNPVTGTMTVTDTAGNPTEVPITFPPVAKGDPRLSYFSYSPRTVTLGGPAPTLRVSSRVRTSLGYSATPADVCTVDAESGALTLAGLGACEVTATAAGTADYNEATRTTTVTVQLPPLAPNVAAIAGDDTVNIAEHAAGFTISGDTGSEAGVSVTVTVGGAELSATSDAGGAWSVDVPANAAYITESGDSGSRVRVSATKAGFTPGSAWRRFRVDLTAPSLTYLRMPATLQVGVRFTMIASTFYGLLDIVSYRATGLPSGVNLGEVYGFITGTPDTANPNPAIATVTVTETSGNSDTVSITFPAVAKGDQTLTGFGYRPGAVVHGDPAPTVTAPTGARGTLSYSATPSTVCAVDSSTGALTIEGVGECVVAATAAGTADYREATAPFTVTVQPPGTLALSLDDPIAGVNREVKAAGFTISGHTGTEAGVSVTVTVGTAVLSATSAANGAWSVRVPPNAPYIIEPGVTVTVSASKTGFTSPSPVTRALQVDVTPPGSIGGRVGPPPSLALLNVDPIAGDDTVNIAEEAAGFAVSGNIGTEAGVTVTVTVGGAELTATSDSAGAWSVSVPANAAYITETDPYDEYDVHVVSVSASKTGFTSPNPVTRRITVDLTAPLAIYLAPATLEVGVATNLGVALRDVDLGASFSATGLPSGLGIDSRTGAIRGTPDTADPNPATATVTVTDPAGNVAEVSITFPAVTELRYAESKDADQTQVRQLPPTLELTVDPIAVDDTINIAEKADGFMISGKTGTEAGVTVVVSMPTGTGSMVTLSTTSNPGGTWSVPTNPNFTNYITETSVSVTVSAYKDGSGFIAAPDVTRTLAVDLTAPSVSYMVPASLQVGVKVTLRQTTSDRDIASRSARGFPAGFRFFGSSRIIGTPTIANPNPVTVTVTVIDTAGNPAEVLLPFPAVDKGEQSLEGFQYTPATVTLSGSVPILTAPTGTPGTVSYSATPEAVCTVDANSGELTLVGLGQCEVTATAEETANYLVAMLTRTVTVQSPPLELNVGLIAGDDTVNIAEKRDGFAISGDTGSEGGVEVSVTIGSQSALTATSDAGGAWSVNVLANASYLTETITATRVGDGHRVRCRPRRPASPPPTVSVASRWT